MTPTRSHTRAGGRRSAFVALVGLALAATMVLPGGPAGGQVATDESDPHSSAELRDEYEELVGEHADVLLAYDESTARLAELLIEVAAADEAKAAADAALVEAEESLAARRDEQVAAEVALVDARERVDRAEATVRRFAIETYIDDGANTDLTLLLDAARGDSASLAVLGYRDSVDTQQGRVIEELEDARADALRFQDRAVRAIDAAEEQRDVVEAIQAEAAAALEDRVRLAEEANAERAQQEQLLRDVQSRLVSIEARLYSLERAADGIQSLLAAYQADDPDFEPGAYSFSLPQEGATISSEFGMRSHPILPVTRLHAGADIGAAHGSPVVASADGVVLLAEERGGYGLTVVVAHENSLATVYAHNSALSVRVGDQVERGQELARVGSTGLSTGPHIHFETRLRGVPINPRNFLLPADGGTGVPGPYQDPDDPFAPDVVPEQAARPGG